MKNFDIKIEVKGLSEEENQKIIKAFSIVCKMLTLDGGVLLGNSNKTLLKPEITQINNNVVITGTIKEFFNKMDAIYWFIWFKRIALLESVNMFLKNESYLLRFKSKGDLVEGKMVEIKQHKRKYNFAKEVDEFDSLIDDVGVSI